MAWLVFKIDWKEVLFYTQKISLGQIVLYVGVLLVGMMISAWKWKILAEFKSFNLSLAKSFQLYLAGTFINNFMPSFIGGDTYRAYQIGKEEKKYSSAAASVVMDRITGLLGAMILSVIFAVLNWRVVVIHSVLLLIIGIVVLCLIGVLSMKVVVKFSLWKKIAGFLPKKLLEVVKDFMQYQGSAALGKSVVIAILFSLVGLAGVNGILFWALGIKLGILNYLTVIFLISIISALPVSINNIGIKEWAYVTFFGFFGVSASAVVTVALVSRILQMIVSFTALPAYLKSRD